MARYIQKIALLGKERWIGWEVDGIGTEVPGLLLADDLTTDELRARGVTQFAPMPFESFLGMGAAIATPAAPLDDRDLDYRLDALQVGLERFRKSGVEALPKSVLAEFFSIADPASDPRIVDRLRGWQRAGVIELVGHDDCFLRIKGT
ncbi:MAG TPA: hypothetical protein VEZ11_09050 [Thermoanaerobaculia bacterium]|nr:hypothetical protein [Thermoanaerobaculia bacterium]